MSKLAELQFLRDGEDALVRVRGEIDLSNAEDVAAEIEEAVSSDAARVVLDLSDLRYLDSAGVRLLLVLAGRLQARRQSLLLRIRPESPIRATVDAAGLAGAVPVEPA